ncbi:related to amino acid transport protein [Rhynchosporium graminicola]|uniref:Related to amino acid transport protein n=1 Tax=Rhynchosporium graminicola TaxID=2792576 RepID=A0A1E1L4F7_9HELO|nr:related to amino acid transport protein [Rhynchosporium commune]
MTSRSNPANWDEYQYGTSASHRGSVSSAGGRSVRFGEQESESSALLDTARERSESGQQGELRRRRSSIGLHLNALAQVGGVNSIENFARSWTRAAGFPEVTPQRPSFIYSGDQDRGTDGTLEYGRTDAEYGRVPRTSLIRAHLAEHGSPENALEDESTMGAESDPSTPRPLDHQESERKRLGSDMLSLQGSVRGSPSMFAIPPHLATPMSNTLGTSYGTVQSSLSEHSMTHAGQLWKQQQVKQIIHGEGDREPLLVKEVEQDGKIVLAVAGRSTLPQTIFNSTNVLIGVGLLSLPMGIKYAGWVVGMTFLLFSAIVTAYTARLLSKCMDVDASLITFADLAYISYGQKARIATSVLFMLELLAACVALVVLFADTLDLLIPGVGVNQWKILCGILLIPLNFAPLRLLSFSSVLGIFSCFCIVSIVFIDGFYKPQTPGSLREPAKTYLFPKNWLTVPLSFGLLMSPWGGHSVFPNIYRDMRHPQKFGRAVRVTFTFTYILDCATAVAGILMFGDGVATEITANLLNTKGYPRSLSIIMSIFIAIIPLTKVPLNARPIVSTIEVFSGLDTLSVSDAPVLAGLSGYTRGILRVVVRVVVIIVFVIIAIIFPAFDSIMAFMGSTLCFTICIILPLMFHLKIFGEEISLKERIMNYVLIVICSIFAVVGTVWAFLPKSLIGAE